MISPGAVPEADSKTRGDGAPTEPGPPELAKAPIGHYEIIRPLGQGGMSQVYLARDTRLGRKVALKFLLKIDAQHYARFEVEAQATAQLSHENIVALHDIGTHRGRPYMVLEHVPGKTLSAWLRERRADQSRSAAVPAQRAAELILPVARALQCAHEAGIVHRDLKPANIMLADSGTVKVLDFGIAKLLDDAVADLPPGGASAYPAIGAAPEAIVDPLEPLTASDSTMTRTGTLLGTQPYMAPEQWRMEAVDGRADLWALGIILYEMITGEHPLGAYSPEVLERVGALDEPMPKARDRLPGLGKLGDLIDRCLIKAKADRLGSARELCEALEAIARPHLGARGGDGDELNPYAGLAAFQERDAASFFGRTAMIEQIVSRLDEQPFLALVGSSGVGKSSLVRAGIVPTLKHSGDAWEAFVLRPGPHPLAALAELLIQQLGPPTRSSERVAGRDPDPADALGDHDAVIERLRREPGFLGVQARSRSRRRHERTLLFIDQFEEVYTLAPQDEREAFFACLAGAGDDASSPLRVIIAIRHDFLDRVAGSSSALAELVSRSTFLVGSLDRGGLRRALVAPAEALSYRFESDALVTEILHSLAEAATALPILQFTATKLWEGRDRERRLLTKACYRAFGGVGGALASHADSVLGALSSTERRLARALLLRLVTPERTRAIVTRRELSEIGGASAAELDRVVDRLIAARLLTVEGAGKDESTIEILHESLIRTWPALAEWLAEAQGDAQFLSRLRVAAKEWEAGRCDNGLLWHGDAEGEARRWLERQDTGSGTALSDRESRYLAAVVALGERARRRRWRLVAAVIAGLSLVVLVVSVLAVRANRAAARAEAERTEAERSAASARNATRMAAAREHQGDPTTVLALLREIEPGSIPRGWAQFARWAPTAGVAEAVLLHEDGVWSVAFSPDGRRIVTAPNDNTVQIWNADGAGAPLVLRGHGDQVQKVAWSPDSKHIVSASSDMTIRVWSADGAGAPLVLRGHEDRVYAASFSPDGRHIVSASRDKTVRVWNADGAGAPRVLRGHDERVYGVSWSPDGRRVVSTSRDKTVRVWNADGAGTPLVLRGHTEPVSWAEFSPDGRHIVSASYDATLRVWNADGSGAPRVLSGHAANVFFATWSPDGTRIASASQDQSLRIWNADGSGAPRVLSGHGDNVYEVAWSPDGRRLVSASLDKTARIWTADIAGPLVLRGHDASVFAAAFSPDGRRIVSTGFDKTIRVWSADGSGQPLVLRGHEDRLYSAAFSPDGRRIVSASFDKTIRIWNADGSGQPLVLRGHDERVYSAAFSRDGRRIVSASNDKTVRVWSADGTGQPLVLRGHDVYAAAFSPDGRRIVSAGFDKTLRVWNADGSGQPLVLRGHQDRLYAAAFSPDGRRIASSSNDRTVRVWDASGLAPPLVLKGHDAAATHVAWSPDGTRIASTAKDGTLRIWNADGTGEPFVLHTATGTNMASWSPDGGRIVAAADNNDLIIWSDLVPLQSADDPKLWTATSYCMPLVIRQQLLGFPEQQSRSDLERCQLRVRGARGARGSGR